VSETGIITLDAGNSIPMAEGATITTYAWDVEDGTITVGTSSSPSITATFPLGFRYVHLTVTDSNGKTHTTHVPVLVYDDSLTLNRFEYNVPCAHRGK
jgi:hypothetical protein